jgi:flagellar biosynthetic protein FliS
MIPARAYRRQPEAGCRIDLLLSLYDGAIERLKAALDALRRADGEKARPLLVRVQMIVLGLAAGVNLEVGDPASANLLRIYEFCVHALTQGKVEEVASALNCLETLREGFRAIRDEAVQLERSGEIPPIEATRLVETVG